MDCLFQEVSNGYSVDWYGAERDWVLLVQKILVEVEL